MNQPPQPPNAPISVEKEMAAAATGKEHVIDQNDPAMQAKVAEFIKHAQGDLGQPKPKPEIPPSPDFDKEPLNIEMNEALDDNATVEVSEYEKSVFMKALLMDRPVRLPIELFNGQMKFELRSRTVFEQTRLFAILDAELENGSIPKGNTAMAVLRFQQFGMALMIEKINGELFSNLAFDGKHSLEEDAKAVSAFVEKHVTHLGQIRWTAHVNAMRNFERKLAKMSTEANSGDFWKPRE